MKSYELEIPREDLGIVIEQTKLPRVSNKHFYIIVYYEKGKIQFSIYDNTKGKPYRARYVGPSLPKYLKSYLVEKEKAESKVETATCNKKITVFPHIGSDEVGFGDFFGPLVVVSAYLDADLKREIEGFNIRDSKLLDDDHIILLGHALKKIVPHIKNVVANPKYNELVKEGYNMNQMKAMLHHNVLVKLAKKQKYKGNLYLDAFTSDNYYKKYTENMDKAPVIQLKNGEKNSLVIATASILARFYFLEEMETLNIRYNTKIPLGAGANVDKFAQEFLVKFGAHNLKSVVKHNFRNFTDLFGDEQGLC
ncbi:MAG: Ribonuclease HIII [Tenericutes bacterium ADurb.Bin239]|nr:MAG: Ribonuclease HIII [Tenericutes bacterium ADurb.Bin239]